MIAILYSFLVVAFVWAVLAIYVTTSREIKNKEWCEPRGGVYVVKASICIKKDAVIREDDK